MLIEVTREVAGQLAAGSAHGLYWRVVRYPAVSYGLSDGARQAAVYIQVFVPESRFSIPMLRLCDETGLPSLYATNCTAIVRRVTGPLCGFQSQSLGQWYECYYGAAYLAKDADTVANWFVTRTWWPGITPASGFLVTRAEFAQGIQPAATHICRCIRDTITPMAADHHLEVRHAD